MLEALLDETGDLLERVEDETGLRLRLVPTEKWYLSRTGLSGILYDSKNNEVTLAYNPKTKSLDYAIAHGAARILRFHQAPIEERYLLSSNFEMRQLAYHQMEDDIMELPEAARTLSKVGFPFFYDGLITQLASQPGDPWIDRWILEQYPGLRAEVEKGWEEVFAKAHQCLNRYAQLITPAAVFRASNAMNAAYAMAADEFLGKERFALPYKGTEFERLGRKLRGYNLTDRGYKGDRETADRWAKELRIEGWFQWAQAVPAVEVRQHQ
jgi:hypothetical protein